MKKTFLFFIWMFLPFMASADSVEIDGIYYNLVSKVKTAEVTSTPNGYFGEVTIPENVTYGGEVYNVTSIGENAFSNSSYLTSITIPNSITSIGSWAFSFCNRLTSANIPNSVISIGSYIFLGCSALTSITIPDNVTIISECAFSRCSRLTSINIPNNVTFIGSYAFHGCGSLTTITIPNNVTSIGECAFSQCDGLTSITIPNSDINILDNAFAKCPELTNVYCYAGNVPNTSSNAFKDSYIEYVTLHVPEGCVDAYKAVEPWNQFKEIVSMTVTKYSLTYLVDGEVYKTCELAEGDEITPEPVPTKEGYLFSGWSTIPATMPAEDVTITGSFQLINDVTYTLTYKVDGEVYKTYELSEGDAITPESSPTKEGYVFSGWSTIPATMPAEDVTITGTFSLPATEDVITLKDSGKGTWCSDYDLDFTDVEGIKAYTATGYDDVDKTIWLTRVFKVPAGTGIMVKGDPGEHKIPHATVKAVYASFFKGVTGTAVTINETDGDNTNYYMAGGQFKKVNGSTTISPNRAYLQLPTLVFAGTRSIDVIYEDEIDDKTGIHSAAITSDQEPGIYYNLQGQRVDNPKKGLYIKNGKKVIIK